MSIFYSVDDFKNSIFILNKFKKTNNCVNGLSNNDKYLSLQDNQKQQSQSNIETIFVNGSTCEQKKHFFNHQISSKIICFDYGNHKIGYAISDDEVKIAFPKNVILGKWFDVNQAYMAMQNVCTDNDIYFIVIGFPKKPDNSLSQNCEKILQIAQKFEQNKYNILLFDERFSTKASTAIYRYESSKTIKKSIKQPQYDDAMSASIILNDVIAILRRD